MYPGRDYKVLTDEESEAWEQVKKREIVYPSSSIRRNLNSEYPKAARHYMSLFPNHFLDPIDLRDQRAIEMSLQGFKDALSKSSARERDILNLINGSALYFIVGALLKKYYNFGHHEAHVFREFPLGTSFKADYLLAGKNSDGWHFVFVELEAPYGRITSNNGDLGEVFRKGRSQIDDWNVWLEKNYGSLQEYFKKHIKEQDQLPEEFCCLDKSRINYAVVAGKRSDFKDKTYRLQREAHRSSQVLLIHYDNLTDAVELLLESNAY